MLSNPKSIFTVVCSALISCLAVACGAAPDTSPNGDVGAVSAPGSQALSMKDAPALPSPTLAVPAGNRLAFHYDAVGVQIYDCKANATGASWVFRAPEATLYGRGGEIEGKHYAGPTWESKDGSKVVASKIAAFTADPASIPELLLGAVSHTGDGRMSGVTYIQRLDTVGGLAPKDGCDATLVGATARVDYTATYYFYEAEEADDATEAE